MLKSIIVGICVALAICGALAVSRSAAFTSNSRSPGPANAIEQARSTAEIRGEVERFRQAVLHKDMQGVARYYSNSPDLVVFDVVPPLSYVGWDSFRKDWEGFFDGFRGISVYDWNDLHIEAAGDLGWMRAVVHIVGTLQDGKPLDMTFRDTAIFNRQAEKWVVVHDHGSVPIVFETGLAVMNAPAK
jgi:ketosteroid isomerase-like protein